MASHCNPGERPIRRHDLIFIDPAAWHSLLQRHGDLAAEPLVAGWVANGWPLVARRPAAGESQGVPLGLPLPPSAGKRRLAFLMRREDVIATSPPLALRSASQAAPRHWRPTLARVEALAWGHSLEAMAFGSLAWAALTGLDYLTDRSDLDLLLHVHGDTDLRGLADGLARIEAAAPMRFDGEFIRHDGAAVNWREFHGDACEVLVKMAGAVALLDKRLFLSGGMPS